MLIGPLGESELRPLILIRGAIRVAFEN